MGQQNGRASKPTRRTHFTPLRSHWRDDRMLCRFPAGRAFGRRWTYFPSASHRGSSPQPYSAASIITASASPLMFGLVGLFTAAFYGWLPLYFPNSSPPACAPPAKACASISVASSPPLASFQGNSSPPTTAATHTPARWSCSFTSPAWSSSGSAPKQKANLCRTNRNESSFQKLGVLVPWWLKRFYLNFLRHGVYFPLR